MLCETSFLWWCANLCFKKQPWCFLLAWSSRMWSLSHTHVCTNKPAHLAIQTGGDSLHSQVSWLVHRNRSYERCIHLPIDTAPVWPYCWDVVSEIHCFRGIGLLSWVDQVPKWFWAELKNKAHLHVFKTLAVDRSHISTIEGGSTWLCIFMYQVNCCC